MWAQTQREITDEAGEWLFIESQLLKQAKPAVAFRKFLVSLHESGDCRALSEAE